MSGETGEDVAPCEETMALIRRLHEIPGCGTGGPLHIVVDDPNHDDGSLDFCEKAIDDLSGSRSQGWWRVGQMPEETREMVTVARQIIANLRPMSVARRGATCTSW